MSSDRLAGVTLHQFAVVLGALIATIVLAFWFAISKALVAIGQTDQLLILVSTFGLSWISLELIQINHLDEEKIEQWGSRVPFVTEAEGNE